MSGPTGEVACDLAVQNADTTRTLDKVGRGEDVDELLNLGAQLVDGRERGELLLGQKCRDARRRSR